MIYEKLKKNPADRHFQNISIEPPRLPATHLIVRGIPAETTKGTVEATVNSYEFGKVANMTRVYRKNTNIYNGYTNVWVEDFNKENLPKYLIIDGYTCHVKTAEDMYTKKCHRCKATSHFVKDCPIPAEPYCRKCRTKGHTETECEELTAQKEISKSNQEQPVLDNSINVIQKRNRLVATTTLPSIEEKTERRHRTTDWWNQVPKAPPLPPRKRDTKNQQQSRTQLQRSKLHRL